MSIDLSICIPTLNSARILPLCLNSISRQKTSHSFEIIIADGGSTDETLKIAQKYNAKIYKNPHKTAEAGKAVAVLHSTGTYLAFIDSDNILPDADWINRMLAPLINDPELIGAEPWEYTYRPHAGFIERYSSLTGVNDPYALISGIYDRKNFLTHKWTDIPLPAAQHKNYLDVTLVPNLPLPTIGANGTIFRSKILKNLSHSDYFFDIDILSQLSQSSPKPLHFAKVKIGIIHTFCENSLKKFIRKQDRRINDYYSFRSFRRYNWNSINRFGIIKFAVYTLLLPLPLIDTVRGFLAKPDAAWFFHPLACIITLYLYSINTIRYWFGLLKPINRLQWSQ